MNDVKIIGFKKSNIFGLEMALPNFEWIDLDDNKKDTADIFFQINVLKNKFKGIEEYKFIQTTNKPYLVCESNLFRKNAFDIDHENCYYRLGWWHFLRNGIFNNSNSPSDRWEKIKQVQNLEVKDWRTKGDYILLALQKAGDSTLNTMYERYGTYYNWIDYAIKQIRLYTDRPILIRPHLKHAKVPFDKFLSNSNKIFLSENFSKRTHIEGGASLEKDFDNAWAVVGYNSNTLVESSMAGIPTFPLDEDSVVWDVSNKNLLENIEKPNLDIDLTQWCYDASYMIWTRQELNNGAAWNHLKGVYFA